MTLSFAPPSDFSLPLFVPEQSELAGWLADQPDHVQVWVAAADFAAALGHMLLVPGPCETPKSVPTEYDSAAKRIRKRFPLAAAAEALPNGTYHIASGVPTEVLEAECFGWLMTKYIFDRYAPDNSANARLIAPDGIDVALVEALANAELLIWYLVNTRTSDLGPEPLQIAAETLSEVCGASCSNIAGNALLDRDSPMIHVVESATAQAPRLIEMNWGDNGPKLTLVGNCDCFDTGKLNLKPDASIGLTKKNMDGAVNVLNLAQMIIKLGLNMRLRVPIPAVKTAVVGNAFRLGDILASRNWQTVEINHTDAEGRLVLADAPELAHEGHSDLVISMTGPTRVAVRADLAPPNTDNDGAAEVLARAGRSSADPVWRMPCHGPYEAMIEPVIAELDNAPSGGFADSLTVAAFLRRFVSDNRYMHFDIYPWQCSKEPGRTKGGLGQGPCALLTTQPENLGL